MKTMKVAFCNGEINNFHAKISVLIVIIVCWSSKYNVNPSIVWKIVGPNSLNYRLVEGGIFDGKFFFFFSYETGKPPKSNILPGN